MPELEWGQITVVALALAGLGWYNVAMYIKRLRRRYIHASEPYAETPPTLSSDVTGLV